MIDRPDTRDQRQRPETRDGDGKTVRVSKRPQLQLRARNLGRITRRRTDLGRVLAGVRFYTICGDLWVVGEESESEHEEGAVGDSTLLSMSITEREL